jgi:hypothetical protein
MLVHRIMIKAAAAAAIKVKEYLRVNYLICRASYDCVLLLKVTSS